MCSTILNVIGGYVVNLKNLFTYIVWFTAIFALLFQCYNKQLSILIAPSVVMYLLLEVKNIKFKALKKWLNWYAVYAIFLCLSMLYSFLVDNSPAQIIRFFLILAIIPFFAIIKEDNFYTEWNIFKLLTTIKVITLAYIWLNVSISNDYSEYRFWALDAGVGDVYITNGITKVQLLGNSLFVISASIELYKNKKMSLYLILMILGALFSGNSAYVLGLALMILFPILNQWYKSIKRNKLKFIFITFIMIVFTYVFIAYAIETLKLKSTFSNVIRLDQARLLLNSNFLFGNGLGNSITGIGILASYTGNETYFELQTLYIINQIGIFGVALFYILTFLPLIEKNNLKMVTAYLVYILYSFWNPYCFDTNHIIALGLIHNILGSDNSCELKNLKGIKKRKNGEKICQN